MVGADMLHLLAGSIWLGGLVGLALTLRELAERGDAAVAGARPVLRARGRCRRRPGGGRLRPRVADRRLLGRAGSTGYGRLLLAKVAFALVAVAIAAWNRYRLLPAFRAGTRQRTRRAGADLLRAGPGGRGGRARRGARRHGVPGRPEPAGGGVGGRPGAQRRPDGDARRRRGAGPPRAADRRAPTRVTLELRDAAGEPFEGFDAPRARLASDEVDLGPVDADERRPRRPTPPRSCSRRRAPGGSRSRCGRASSTTR